MGLCPPKPQASLGSSEGALERTTVTARRESGVGDVAGVAWGPGVGGAPPHTPVCGLGLGSLSVLGRGLSHMLRLMLLAPLSTGVCQGIPLPLPHCHLAVEGGEVEDRLLCPGCSSSFTPVDAA